MSNQGIETVKPRVLDEFKDKITNILVEMCELMYHCMNKCLR